MEKEQNSHNVPEMIKAAIYQVFMKLEGMVWYFHQEIISWNKTNELLFSKSFSKTGFKNIKNDFKI